MKVNLLNKSHLALKLEKIFEVFKKKIREVIQTAAQDKILEHNNISFQVLRTTLLILLFIFI